MENNSKIEQFVMPNQQVEKEVETSIESQPTQEVEVKQETNSSSLMQLTDAFEIHKLINEYTPNVTKRIPVVVQGIPVESETLLLSDLYSIAQSDNGRIKAITMLYDKLTKTSKAVFNNDINIFLKCLSIYDVDLFYATHSESFGDEEFVFKCDNSDCEKEVEFKSKMRDLRVTSDSLEQRISDIKDGKEVPMYELKDNLIKINDDISFRVGICSLDKYKTLLERKNLSAVIYKTLLQLEAIVFTKVNKELLYDPKHMQEIVQFLEKCPLPKDYREKESKIFDDLNISFEAKIKCPHCGHINHKYKNDLLGDLVKKAMA